VRFRNATALALGVMVLGASPAAFAANSTSQPTQAQIRAAVRAAERSTDLWATINLCDTRQFPDQVGLRGEMPALGFSSGLYMTFEVYYRSGSTFKPDRRTRDQEHVGRWAGSSVHQSGVTFTFASPATFRGEVIFTWRLKGKVIGRIARMTTAHHKHVDFSHPRGYSAARCTIS
jgi:hypothetical protein